MEGGGERGELDKWRGDREGWREREIIPLTCTCMYSSIHINVSLCTL